MHAQHRAIARIDPLDFARDEPVGHITRTRAAIALRQHHTEEAETAHLGKNRRVRLLGGKGFDDTRQQFLLRIIARRIADQSFLIAELLLDEERIVPLEVLGLGRGAQLALHALYLSRRYGRMGGLLQAR